MDKKDLYDASHYSLSDGDIKKYLGSGTKIIKYEELDKYNSITELLPNDKDFVVLLFEREPDVGHWVCVIRNKKSILYFDPYGNRVDKIMVWNSNYMNKKLGQDFPYLSWLLNKAVDDGFKVTFSEVKFQDEKSNFTTCGRWVCSVCFYFMHNEHPTLRGFYNKIVDLGRKFELVPDLVVTKIME
jgi:hypothetical protein